MKLREVVWFTFSNPPTQASLLLSTRRLSHLSAGLYACLLSWMADPLEARKTDANVAGAQAGCHSLAKEGG